jgi:hypothetical protein
MLVPGEPTVNSKMMGGLSLVILPHKIKRKYLAEHSSEVTKALGPKSW